ncbi:hypothetical protein Cgig2_027401 [Carnegiea gigantea]|uniref:Uncharacterized protein n=1 Tax=Carnegiea gigantea TaxID=171969 RepID=A0A9Q1K4L7_9CARY|nr:hypothetical protein Cgig2_027401 [Carnegiea gigantea]
MGASSSTEAVSKEAREVESQAASTGALPLLQKSFSNLADPLSNSIPLSSLQDCFSLKYTNIICEGGADLPDCFLGLLDQMGTSIADTLCVPQKGGITWVEFVKGYIKCCGRMSASLLLNILFRVIALAAERAGCPLNLNFDSNDVDTKASGSISPKDLGMILWVCWVISWNSRKSKQATESNVVNLPDLNHLPIWSTTTAPSSALAAAGTSIHEVGTLAAPPCPFDYTTRTRRLHRPPPTLGRHLWPTTISLPP